MYIKKKSGYEDQSREFLYKSGYKIHIRRCCQHVKLFKKLFFFSNRKKNNRLPVLNKKKNRKGVQKENFKGIWNKMQMLRLNEKQIIKEAELLFYKNINDLWVLMTVIWLPLFWGARFHVLEINRSFPVCVCDFRTVFFNIKKTLFLETE